MTKVKFYDSISDELLKFAVIISKTQGKWVFCKHKERDTYEVPGRHREENTKKLLCFLVFSLYGYSVWYRLWLITVMTFIIFSAEYIIGRNTVVITQLY